MRSPMICPPKEPRGERWLAASRVFAVLPGRSGRRLVDDAPNSVIRGLLKTGNAVPVIDIDDPQIDLDHGSISDNEIGSSHPNIALFRRAPAPSREALRAANPTA